MWRLIEYFENLRAQLPNFIPLTVISDAETGGGKEHLKVAPQKRQLLDSDEEQEEDEGRSQGRESDWDVLFLLTCGTLLFSPEDKCCPLLPL